MDTPASTYFSPMAKQVKMCAGCGAPLSFMNTPNFGGGRLLDGERVCRRCFAYLAKVHPSFGLRSRKDHTAASVRVLLSARAARSGPAGNAGPGEHGGGERSEDPVDFLLDALKTGEGRKQALKAARRAHKSWWAIDVSDREHSMEELQDLWVLRAFVLCTVATVHVWNGEFSEADEIQPQFIGTEGLWSGKKREAVELYLVHLIFQEQWARIESIFSQAPFRSAFLDYHDLFRSVQDPHYEFQSKQGPFLNTVNKVNHYCMQVGRKRLF